MTIAAIVSNPFAYLSKPSHVNHLLYGTYHTIKRHRLNICYSDDKIITPVSYTSYSSLFLQFFFSSTGQNIIIFVIFEIFKSERPDSGPLYNSFAYATEFQFSGVHYETDGPLATRHFDVR